VLDDAYKTISKACEGLYKSKGSKFYAFGYSVANEDQVKLHLKNLKKKYHDARHHCYAYQLVYDHSVYRMNDDGEPSGTAGKPIYGRILSHELTDILIVVIRYFGGTLLGTSGLIKAYRSSAEDCIKNASVIERTIDVDFEIIFQYEQVDKVMRAIKEGAIKINSQIFEHDCRMKLSIRMRNYEKAANQLMKVQKLKLIKF